MSLKCFLCWGLDYVEAFLNSARGYFAYNPQRAVELFLHKRAINQAKNASTLLSVKSIVCWCPSRGGDMICFFASVFSIFFVLVLHLYNLHFLISLPHFRQLCFVVSCFSGHVCMSASWIGVWYACTQTAIGRYFGSVFTIPQMISARPIYEYIDIAPPHVNVTKFAVLSYNFCSCLLWEGEETP